MSFRTLSIVTVKSVGVVALRDDEIFLRRMTAGKKYLCCLGMGLMLLRSSIAGALATEADSSTALRRSDIRIADQDVEQIPAPQLPPAEQLSSDQGPGARWRYRYHCERWWYTDIPGHWLFWDGRRWQEAQPTRPKIYPDGSVERVGLARRALAAWPQVPSYHEHHGWVGGFYSSGGGYGSSDFGYGYGVPNYGPWPPR